MTTLRRYADRADERKALLDRTLLDFVSVCQRVADVRAVYVFGPVAIGDVGPSSDLDLLVVRQTSLPYHYRGDDLRLMAKADAHVDLVVVTPDEYQNRLPKTSFGRIILESARCVYAA